MKFGAYDLSSDPLGYKTSPKLTFTINYFLPLVALSLNQNFQQSSSYPIFSFEPEADLTWTIAFNLPPDCRGKLPVIANPLDHSLQQTYHLNQNFTLIAVPKTSKSKSGKLLQNVALCQLLTHIKGSLLNAK